MVWPAATSDRQSPRHNVAWPLPHEELIDSPKITSFMRPRPVLDVLAWTQAARAATVATIAECKYLGQYGVVRKGTYVGGAERRDRTTRIAVGRITRRPSRASAVTTSRLT